MSSLDPVDEDFRRCLSHLVERDVDSGEHGRQVLSHVDVVDADDRDVCRDFESIFLQGPHDADGCQVVGTENGGHVFCTF